MEQFKNSDPHCTALYVNEQKPTTTLHIAELADDFVLTHKSGCAVHSGGDVRELKENSFPCVIAQGL